MRKFLFLLVALIMSVASAWAQETVSGAAGTIKTSPALVDGNFASGTTFYTIAINRNNCMLDSRYLPTVQQKKAAACDENKWAVLAAESGYQFINKATKKALTFASSANDATASLTENFEDTNSIFEFTTSQNSSFQSGYEVFRIAGTDEAYPNDKGVGLAIWASAQALWGWGASAEKPSTGDAGSQFKFTMVEELVLNTFSFTLPDGVTVTYDGKTYSNGQSVQVMGAITTTQVTVNETAPTGYHYDIQVDATNHVVTVTLAPDPVLGIDDINPNKAYYIYTVARGGLTLKSVDDTRLWGTSEEGVGQTVDGTNPLQQFAFITYKDNLYLYSIGAQKFVNSSSTGKLEDTPADPIGFANPGEGSVRLLFSSSMNFNLGGSNQVTIGTWATKDAGNKFIILPVADFDPAPVLEALNSTTFVDVTYMVTNVDGVEVPYVVENVKAGELAAIPEISGYLTDPVMTDTDCIVSETNKTFHVTGTWEFPFDESKYYTMHSAKTDEYQDYVCNGTVAWCNGSVAVADNNNVWQLAHVAGTLDLFTLKNYGYNKYAVLPSNGRVGCTFADAPTVWTEGTGATSYFRVVKQNGGFNLQHPGDAETNVGSHYDNMLGSWMNANSATNASSINIVTETTPTVPAAKATVVYNYNYAGSLWKSVSVEQTVGEAVAAPAIAFANLEYDNETLVSEDGNTVEVTVTDNLPFVAAADYASITKWYNVRLHSNQTHYMYVNEDAVAFTDAVAETNKNAYAWAFIGNLKDGFKMVNYVAGESKAVNNVDPCAMSEEGYAFPIVATNENVAGGFCFESATGSYLNYQGAAIKRWNEADAGSTFRVTEVEIDENPVTPVDPETVEFVTSLDQLSNDMTYTIRSNRRGWWTGKAESDNIWQTNGRDNSDAAFTSGSGKEQDAEDADQQWAILKSENGNYYLYNVGQQKFFASSDSYANKYAKATLAADVNGAVVLSNETGTCTGDWLTEHPEVCWAIGKDVNGTNHFFGVTNWEGQSWQVFENNEDYNKHNDEGMYFAIVPAEVFAATAKAEALAAIAEFENAELPELPETFPAAGTYYVTFTGKDSARPQHLYNDLTQADGYTLAASKPEKTNAFIWRAECNGTDMTIKNGQGQTIGMYGKHSDGNYYTSELTYTAHSDCYYLLPKNATGMKNTHNCLNQSNSSTYANANGTYTVTSWSTTAGPNANDNHWYVNVVDDMDFYDVVIEEGTGASEFNYSVATYVNFDGQHAANGGFFAVAKDATVSVEDLSCTNVPAGKQANYEINGKTITVTFTDREGKDWDAYENLLAELFDAYGTGLGEYSVADMDDADVMEALNVYNIALNIELEDVYDENMAAMQSMKNNLVLNMPKAGSFLRIKGGASGNYVAFTGNDGSRVPQQADGTDAKTIIYYAEDGTIISYYNGKGMTGTHSQAAVSTTKEKATFTASKYGVGKYCIQSDFSGSKVWYDHETAVNRNSVENSVNCSWILEEVETLPVTIGAAGLATLYAPVALTVPNGVAVYTIAENGEYLKATAFTGVIPANTGVVLEATEGVYNFDITTGGEATSCLTGTVPTINKVDGALVLGVKDGQEGFYSPKAETLAGFKAYYVNASGSNFRITFDNLTDIISAVKENGGQAIFDLQGRRVVNAKGVTIQNGKKVVK